MLREDIIWLLPAVLIASYQVFVIWRKQPPYHETDTERAGSYLEVDKLRINYFVYSAVAIFFIQLSHPIIAVTQSLLGLIFLRGLGYMLIFLGFVISYLAIYKLGNNWSGMQDFRIKKNQQLVTSGIYTYIRHPIYTAAILEVVGYQLVANSWLVILFLIVGGSIVYKHVILEDHLLAQEFGEQYSLYKSKTKMFIPFII